MENTDKLIDAFRAEIIRALNVAENMIQQEVDEKIEISESIENGVKTLADEMNMIAYKNIPFIVNEIYMNITNSIREAALNGIFDFTYDFKNTSSKVMFEVEGKLRNDGFSTQYVGFEDNKILIKWS